MNPVNHPTRRRFASLSGALLIAALSYSATAQAAYPDHVIKVVVPWPAGGTADVVTRVVTDELSNELKQPVIVVNKPGANSIPGTDSVARADPDGYTLLVASVETASINPNVYSNLPYNWAKDFVPIASFATSPYVLAARNGLNVSSLKDLSALAKANPGKLTYGSWGIGSTSHAGMEMIAEKVGLPGMLHVPYNGGPKAFNAVAAGEVDLLVLPNGLAPGLRNAGKIKVFAVTASRRMAGMEDVPTLKEQGYDVELAQSLGFMAPAGTPQAVIDRLATAVNAVLKKPAIQSALTSRNVDVFMGSREDYAVYLRTELKRWGDVIRRSGIKAELR